MDPVRFHWKTNDSNSRPGLNLVILSGIYLAIGGWNTSLLKANFLGALLVILSSLVYAVYLVLTDRLVHRVGSVRVNAYGMLAASLAMVIYLAIKAQWGLSINLFQYNLSVYGIFFIIGVVPTVVSSLLIVEGIKQIGAERASIISMLGPVITIVFGSLFLGEKLDPIQWIGCLIVLFALILIEWKKIKK